MCLEPVIAISLMKNEEDKHVLKILAKDEFKKIDDLKYINGADEVFLLPCMKCKECREDYAKDWAVRCSLESYMHKFNYFVTLTFDNWHLPFSSKSCKKDFSEDFLKKLGYLLTGKRDRPKFFACVERGELTQRYHLHCILFLDKELSLKDPVKLGDFYHFHSDEISKCWSYGLHDITPFDHDCSAYVAKYSTKEGNCFMSRNLAKTYYFAHKDEILKDDFKIYVDFNNRNYIDIPKCFARWFLEDDVNQVNDFKLRQKDFQRLYFILKLQRLKYSDESQYQASKIITYLKHHKYDKERSEL